LLKCSEASLNSGLLGEFSMLWELPRELGKAPGIKAVASAPRTEVEIDDNPGDVHVTPDAMELELGSVPKNARPWDPSTTNCAK
jgi:hypothetical protein